MARPRKSTKVEEAKTEVKKTGESEVLKAGFKPVNEAKDISMNPSPKALNVYSVRVELWHPFQKRMIPVNDPVTVIEDNWLKAQMKAGLIKEL